MMQDDAAGRRNARADFRLSIGGESFEATDAFADATGIFRPRLMSLRLTEKRGGEADTLEIVLDDSDGKVVIPPKGVICTLAIGWARGSDVPIGLVEKGRYKIDDAGWSSAAAQVTISARSVDLTSSFRTRQERSHKATTLGAVARKVASAHGLTAQIAPGLAAIAVPILVQDQKSDMALLRELGRRHDAIATIKDGKLILAPIGAGVTATGKTIPAAAITFADGDRATWKRLERDGATEVEARYHDKGSATRKSEKAKVGAAAGGTVRRLKRTYHSQADAKAAAAAEAGRIKRKAAEFSIELAYGRPDLYPDRKVTLSGFKAGIDGGAWLIAELSHSLDGRGGLSTALKLEKGS